MKPYNEAKVGPRGFMRLFCCLKINKMESKNDYYLIECSKHHIKEMDLTYVSCVYSNGFKEHHIEFKYGQHIPTILPYNSESSYVGLD